MAEDVVDLLEAIEVDQRQRQRPLLRVRLLDGLGEADLERIAVEATGEPVDLGRGLDPGVPLGVRAGERRELGEPLHQLDVGGRDRALGGEAGYDEGAEAASSQRSGAATRAAYFIERRRLGRGKPVLLVAVGDQHPPGLHGVAAEARCRWLAKPDQGPVDAGDSGDASSPRPRRRARDDGVAAERLPDLVTERLQDLLGIQRAAQRLGGANQGALLGATRSRASLRPDPLERVADGQRHRLEQRAIGFVEAGVIEASDADQRAPALLVAVRREHRASGADAEQVLALEHRRRGRCRGRCGWRAGRASRRLAPERSRSRRSRARRYARFAVLEQEGDLGVEDLAELLGEADPKVRLVRGGVDQRDDLGPPRDFDEAAAELLARLSRKRR